MRHRPDRIKDDEHQPTLDHRTSGSGYRRHTSANCLQDDQYQSGNRHGPGGSGHSSGACADGYAGWAWGNSGHRPRGGDHGSDSSADCIAHDEYVSGCGYVPAAAVTVAANAPTITQTAAVYVSVGTADVLVQGLAPSITVTGIVVVPDQPQQAGGGRGGRRQRRKTIVEIDGEEYIVGSVEEAKHLLAQKRQALLDAAPAAAKKALNKARDVERKTGAMPELVVEVPEIEVEGDASPTMQALVERAQRSINEAYVQAAQSAELALLARRSYMAQDEEDAIAVLLLS